MPTIDYTTQLSSTDVHGSITYLKLPKDSPFKGIVPFKSNDEPYGNWPNTTKCNIGGNPNKHQCPITQTTYSDGSQLPDSLGTLKWKCSEVAYHAQKLLNYRQELEKAQPKDQNKINYLEQWISHMQSLPLPPKNIFHPRYDWDPILTQIAKYFGEYDYNKNNYFPFNKKLKARPDDKENYERMKFVVKLKLNQHPALMDQAKFFATNNLIPVECSDKDDTWASGVKGDGKNLLGRIIFELGTENLDNNDKTKVEIQNDTEKKYNLLKQKQQQNLTHGNLLSHNPANMTLEPINYQQQAKTTSQTKTQPDPVPPKITAINATQAKEQIKAAIIKKLNNKNPTKLELLVANDQESNKSTQKILKVTFGTKSEAKDFVNATKANNTENNGLTVILGQEKTKFFFNEHNLNTHLITILAQDKKEQKILANPNKSAKERVLDKIPNASNIEIDNNNNLIVNFNSKEDADNFSKTNNNVWVKNQNDNFVVILNQDQLNQFLQKNNIATHGITAQIPMMKALKYEQSCNNIESCFNFKKSTNDDLKNIQYKKLWNATVAEKVAKNTQDTIGTICSTDHPNSKDLAIIKENSIECPTDSNLTPTQNEIFITFLEMHNNPNITIEANNFSPKDLNALLNLLLSKNPKLQVKLELPELDKCVHGNNEKYTETEYNAIKAKIDKYNTTLNPSDTSESTPKPPKPF